MTPEELAADRAMCDAATPGPWYEHNPDDELFMNVLLVSDSPREPDMGEPPNGEIEYGEVIALTLFQYPRVVDHKSKKWDENTAFIAAARTRWPAALDEIERLQTENAALRAQVAGHAERIAAQSELLSRRAEK